MKQLFGPADEVPPTTAGAWTARPGFGIAAAVVVLPVLMWLGHPALALLGGAVIAVAGDRPVFGEAGCRIGALSLQAAIVLLGIKLDLATVWALSAQYTALVAGYVLITLALGIFLGRLLRVDATLGGLISAGTAICGGTAVATLSGVVRAQPQQTAVALGIVFLLNMVALFSFPAIGRALELSELQFGLWSALAIHDTSSVIATATVYGQQAAEVATTLKLGRTLWLIPLVLGAAALMRRRQPPPDGPQAGAGRVPVPWFVLCFLAAAACGSAFEVPAGLAHVAGQTSKVLLVVALFLVGSQMTRDTVRRIRGRVLWQALALWLLVAPATLLLVLWGA